MNEVLCIYDTRYIQRYIFSPGSEEVQIGAGILVARILPEGLEAALKASGLSEREYRLDYAGNPEYIPFLDNEDIKAELISVGGGNAIMLYRNRELCRKVNRLFSRYILEHTHTLQIDLGVISKTDSFSNDINRIYRQANVAKNKAVTARPMGALPIAQMEKETGCPLSARDPETGEKISMDNFCKLSYYPAEFADFYRQDGIAYIHIDGNEMSLSVNNIMNSSQSYREGIVNRRKVSEHITRTYQAALDAIEKRLAFTYGESVHRYFQVLNFGGDDINLRCGKNLTLEVVTAFSDYVKDRYIWNDPETGRVPFSVSVGIAFVPQNVTFSQGERMAKGCCDKAKAMAKKPENRIGGFAGNWMDYCVYETSAPENMPEHPCRI